MPHLSNMLMIMVLFRHHTHPQISFRDTLTPIARKRRSRRVTRLALQNPSIAPFMILLQSMCDQSLITMTGFDHTSFVYLLNLFTPYYEKYTPYSGDGNIKVLPANSTSRGRPRTMNALQCLGLILPRHRTRGSMWSLCMLFGITQSVCSLFLRFGGRILIITLSKNKYARVNMPTLDEIEEYKDAFKSKYRSLQHVFAVTDGLKLHLQQSGDFVIQNMFYNGWTHDHYVSNVLVFAPSGLIVSCALNAPGSMYDSQIAEWGGIYDKLGQEFVCSGAQCVVHSAFAQKSYPFLIKSAQDETNCEGPFEMIQMRQATSARQASEWGMRAFQGSFPRMKDRFYYEETGERKLVLLCTVLLFNLRSRLVGINQILNTYMPHLAVEGTQFCRNVLNLT